MNFNNILKINGKYGVIIAEICFRIEETTCKTNKCDRSVKQDECISCKSLSNLWRVDAFCDNDLNYTAHCFQIILREKENRKTKPRNSTSYKQLTTS